MVLSFMWLVVDDGYAAKTTNHRSRQPRCGLGRENPCLYVRGSLLKNLDARSRALAMLQASTIPGTGVIADYKALQVYDTVVRCQ